MHCVDALALVCSLIYICTCTQLHVGAITIIKCVYTSTCLPISYLMSLFQARVSLIKLYLSTGDTQQSEEHCLKLMRSDDGNDEDDSAALVSVITCMSCIIHVQCT